jgi:hypothetical protein
MRTSRQKARENVAAVILQALHKHHLIDATFPIIPEVDAVHCEAARVCDLVYLILQQIGQHGNI